MKARSLPITSLLVLCMTTGSAWAQPAPPDDEPLPDEEGETFEPTEDEGETFAPTEAEDAPAEQPPADEEAPAEEAPAEEPPQEYEWSEEDFSDEELGVVDTEAPPPKGMGVITGTLTETKLNEPLIEAQVEVLGTDKRVITDFDGNYRLELPPGTYNLRFWYELHQAKQVQGVTVKAGELVRVDEALVPEEGAIETFEIETEADTSSIEGQLLSRRRASVVGDAIGRQEISRTPDSNAAAAARRVVGAIIVDDRFIYVRGLGERYANALLDGVPLPSPEPDRQAVPLDLFPAHLLDSLVIVKSFVPDMPGDFAGGSVRIGTRRLPEEFTFSVSAGIGLNSQATGSDYLQYRGSSTDWLGVDGGTRQLPGSIPDYRIGRGNRNPDGSFQTSEQLRQWGSDINAFMSTQEQTAPPNHNFSLTIGNTFDFDDDQKLGVMGAFEYRRAFFKIDDELFRTAASSEAAPDDITEQNRFSIDRGTDIVRYGGLLGLTYQIDQQHTLHLTGLYTRRSDDEARELEGYAEERGAPIHETRLQFVARDLISGQLRGEHTFEGLDDAKLDWQAFLSVARREQPDTRAVVYQFDSNFGYRYEDDSFSGLHFYADQTERTVGGGFNWLQPLVGGKEPVDLKVGALVSVRDRQFNARRFRFRPINGVDQSALVCDVDAFSPSCSDQVFDAANIESVLSIEENTQSIGDNYTAGLDVYSGYVMVDAHLLENLRVIAGPRLELSKQTIETFDPFLEDAESVRGEIDGQDILPALSIVWGVRDDMNLRFAASRTLARPQLREIAPFSFADYFGGYLQQGNPDLDNTAIYNGDVRWEWFPSGDEVLAASVFGKHFISPIEPILKASSGNGVITYQNAEAANLIGAEIEARKNFGFIADPLEDLSIIGNLTLATSEVVIDTTDPAATNLRSLERPLTNQAPWVVNLALDYDHEEIGFQVRALYNVIGPRIAIPSENPIPDIYYQPRHELGATVSQRIVEGLRVKVTGNNLLNSEFRYTFTSQNTDENLHRRWREGIRASLSASYTY